MFWLAYGFTVIVGGASTVVVRDFKKILRLAGDKKAYRGSRLSYAMKPRLACPAVRLQSPVKPSFHAALTLNQVVELSWVEQSIASSRFLRMR